jgi:hypothetical protein
MQPGNRYFSLRLGTRIFPAAGGICFSWGIPYSYYWFSRGFPRSSLGFGYIHRTHSNHPFSSQNRVGLKVYRPTPENKANETIHFSDRDVDFREHGLGRYEDVHKSILYYQANVQQTFIEITENDYKLCPDFGSIYKKLYEPNELNLDDRVLKNMQSHMDLQAGMRANKQNCKKVSSSSQTCKQRRP